MRFNQSRTLLVFLLLSGLACLSTASASDVDDLTSMLHAFLAGATSKEAHERFWADDLIYTSSAGGRTNKAEIMSSFDTVDDDPESSDDEPGPVYTAEDIQVQVHGTTAVVAFRLVGTTVKSSDGEAEVQEYFNTGTFVKRDGQWRVVAWQATIIPAG
jgi:ketosteroid isomerase-like protein